MRKQKSRIWVYTVAVREKPGKKTDEDPSCSKQRVCLMMTRVQAWNMGFMNLSRLVKITLIIAFCLFCLFTSHGNLKFNLLVCVN